MAGRLAASSACNNTIEGGLASASAKPMKERTKKSYRRAIFMDTGMGQDPHHRRGTATSM